MSKGQIIILSGPSGVGKDTVIDAWQKINPMICKVVTCTTRAIREGEQEGIDYLFMNINEFEKKIKENYFIEHTRVYDHYYGTPKAPIFKALENGNWIILKIDVQGALKIMKIFPEAITLFLMPPNFKELEQRIYKRGKDSSQAIQKRLEKAQLEIEQAKHYKYIVINEDILKTVNQLEEIFKENLF